MIQLPLLFKTQKGLDDHIVEKKGLQSKNLLKERVLAFQVELAELTNEWRGFKFWSSNQSPTTHEVCAVCEDKGEVLVKSTVPAIDRDIEILARCPACDGVKSTKNPFLEEYVDVLHFLLSIGNTLGINDIVIDSDYTKESTIETIIDINAHVAYISQNESSNLHDEYEVLFNKFIGLGEKHSVLILKKLKKHTSKKMK